MLTETKSATRRQTSDTATRVLDVAERLAQTRGFNGFSYADVAEELDMTTAAMHYHFPSKAELGVALMSRYHARFSAALQRIDDQVDKPMEKLDAYVGLYVGVLENQRMCLCGMLAAEYETLPESVRETIDRFVDTNERWLAHVFDDGRAEGSLEFFGDPEDAAHMLFSGLEGAMLLSNVRHDVGRFRGVAEFLLEGVRPA